MFHKTLQERSFKEKIVYIVDLVAHVDCWEITCI
jgi:hypothetical protein